MSLAQRSPEEFNIKFWGTRGSIPAPGPGTLRYGGNTACIEVQCGSELIIIDAGTGIRNLGTRLLNETPVKASILFSHMHWDHIQGIPFFRPIYIPENEFMLYGNKNWDMKLEYVLRWQMQKPTFPVSLEEISEVGAYMEYIDVDEEAIFCIGDKDEIIVQNTRLRHTDTTYAFRIDYDGRSLVYASDTENLPEIDKKLVELASGADILIHDAQYTNEEYKGLDGPSRRNWGHSTPEAAAKLAAASGVKKLVLFHHDPYHDDAQIDKILEIASTIFPNTIAASENATLELQRPSMVSGEFCLGETGMPHVYYSASEASS